MFKESSNIKKKKKHRKKNKLPNLPYFRPNYKELSVTDRKKIVSTLLLK